MYSTSGPPERNARILTFQAPRETCGPFNRPSTLVSPILNNNVHLCIEHRNSYLLQIVDLYRSQPPDEGGHFGRGALLC